MVGVFMNKTIFYLSLTIVSSTLLGMNDQLHVSLYNANHLLLTYNVISAGANAEAAWSAKVDVFRTPTGQYDDVNITLREIVKKEPTLADQKSKSYKGSFLVNDRNIQFSQLLLLKQLLDEGKQEKCVTLVNTKNLDDMPCVRFDKKNIEEAINSPKEIKTPTSGWIVAGRIGIGCVAIACITKFIFYLLILNHVKSLR